MFDLFDPSKLFVVGVVALIVIGPKELPRVLRTVGQITGRMRRMAAEFQSQFNEAMREAELEDVKKELANLNEATKVDVAFDPATLTQHDNAKMIEGPKPAEAGPSEIKSEASVEAAPAQGQPLAVEAKPAEPAPAHQPAALVDDLARESGAP